MGTEGYRRFCVVVLVISLFVIVTNAGIYSYVESKGSLLNPWATAEGTVNLTIEPYVPTIIVEVPVGVPGGGGGGFPSGAIYDFGLDQNLIKVIAKIGETVEKIVEVSNLNTIFLNFNVSTDMEEFVSGFEESFGIIGKNKKNITFTFTAPLFAVPDVYTGNIYFVTQYSQKKLPVIFEIQSKKLIFEVNLDTPAGYKTLQPGEDIFFQITIFALGEDIVKGNVALEYVIKDFNDNVIVKLEEGVFVDKQLSFGKTIALPDGLPEGNYVVLVRAKYDATVALSSEMFTIGKAVAPFTVWLLVILGVLLLLVLLVYYELQRSRLARFAKESPANLAAIRKKIVIGHLKGVEAENELKRLRKQRELLDQAFASGYIKEDTYKASKKKIAELVRNLREKYL